MTKPRIAITPGDPRGIGPEVARAAIQKLGSEALDVSLVVIGPEGVLDASTPMPSWPAPSPPSHEGGNLGEESELADAEAGEAAARAIEHAVELALAGEIHALVTGPLHKPSLHAAGRKVPGQTEMLQGLAGADRVGMLMAAEHTRLGAPLRVLLATTHLPLREVPAAVDASLLEGQTLLLDAALRTDWGMEQPRIGLCALNPHASDGGLFGDEEARVFGPALHRIREAGVDARGPVPADTVFSRALTGEFDAVVAPYHDVGMAAFKTVSFGGGVNVTLGLPFVRTSPDHGTAFEIVGTGRADSASMLEAIRLAARLASARFDVA